MAKRKKRIDPEKKVKNDELKKAIGDRFKKFRKVIDKPQHYLAEELDVFQSTITNFELGKTFPNSGYLYHFFEKYGLNIHWLFTGQGNKFVPNFSQQPDMTVIKDSGAEQWGSRYEDYIDLLKHMQMPEIEKIILGKLTELKEIYKDKINTFNFDEFDLERKNQGE